MAAPLWAGHALASQTRQPHVPEVERGHHICFSIYLPISTVDRLRVGRQRKPGKRGLTCVGGDASGQDARWSLGQLDSLLYGGPWLHFWPAQCVY